MKPPQKLMAENNKQLLGLKILQIQRVALLECINSADFCHQLTSCLALDGLHWLHTHV